MNPYFVEPSGDGCSQCGHDRHWDVVGPDGVALGTSFGDMEEAEDIADWMSRAWSRGYDAGVSDARKPIFEGLVEK